MTVGDGDPEESGLWSSLADLVIYAPIGLTLDAQDLAPDLARRGRQHTAAARRIGEFAVKAGMRRLDELVAALDPSPADESRAEDAPTRPTARPPAPTADAAVSQPDVAVFVATDDARSDERDDASREPEDLAIPDYDLLAASQVVKRLDGLDPDQLDAIRRHEEAGRGRRTILHKITRLQAG